MITRSKIIFRSGGERQGMSIARGLYNDPEVIIMDEPFSSVDDETRDIITNFLKFH